MYDYTKLLSKIAEVYGGTEPVPAVLGISEYAFANKLNNKSQFKQGEIATFIKTLNIPDDEIKAYFFEEKL